MDQVEKEFPELILSDLSRYRIIKSLGKGASAEVFLVKDLKTEEKLALKKLYTSATQDQAILFAREVRTMATAKHPFLLQIIGFFPKTPFSILTEYMPGSLYKYLQSPTETLKLTGTIRTKIAMGIADAMDSLHEFGIVHRDLKSLNVLLDKDFFPHLCDFGIARFYDNNQNLTNNIGTIRWMAPEILNDENYGPEVDIYSYAILLYELLTNSIPWKGMENPEIMSKVLVKNMRPALPEDTPPNLAKLIACCWHRNPSSRPPFSEIYKAFATHKVEFPNTDSKQIDKLDHYLSTFKMSSLSKDSNKLPKRKSKVKNVKSQESIDVLEFSPSYAKSKPKTTVKKQSNDNDAVQFKIPKSPFVLRSSDDDIHDFSPNKKMSPKRQRYDYEIKTQSPLSRDTTDSIQVENEQYFAEIDLKAVSNTKHPKFREEMIRASIKVHHNQMKDFFGAISHHFNSNISKKDICFILTCIRPILKSKTAIDAFFQYNIHLKLPIESKTESFNYSLDILLDIFERAPQLFDSSFEPHMKQIISLSPKKAIILLAIYSKAFLIVNDPWTLLDLLIKYSKAFLKSPRAGPMYISTLYYLCTAYDEYSQERLSNCRTKFLLASQSSYIPTALAGYRALATFFSPEISKKLDLDIIVHSLSVNSLVSSVLDLLLVYVDSFSSQESDSENLMISDQLIQVLIENTQIDEKAFCLMLKISEEIEGARSLLRFPVWVGHSSDLRPDESLKLLISIARHKKLRPAITQLPEIGILFKRVADMKESGFLIAISSTIRRLPINEEFLEVLSEQGSLESIFKAGIKLGDDKTLIAVYNLVLSLSEIGIKKEFLLLAQSLKNSLKLGSNVTTMAIIVIASMSKDPLCIQKFKELNLPRYFKKLEKEPDYAQYSHTFFKNLASAQFYDYS